MWTDPGEPYGHLSLLLGGGHNGRLLVADWAHNGVSTGLVIFKDSCVDFYRPTGFESRRWGCTTIIEFILQHQLAGVTVIALTHHFSNIRVRHSKLEVVVESCASRFGEDIKKYSAS